MPEVRLPADDAAPDVRLQHEIDRLQADLSQARQALEDLNYAISHDLRAPLRHVRAYLQIVEEDFGEGLAPALRGHLRTVDEAASQMVRMVDALLELSRLRLVGIQLSVLDPGVLLQQACAAVDAQDPPVPRTGDLEWRIAGDFPQVWADAGIVLQVLHRLLSNAAKFTRRQATPCVQVSWQVADVQAPRGEQKAERDAGRCVVRIVDNGAGFDPRQVGGLFKPFQRLHPHREFEGLGMGLAWVQLALRRMGGDIQVSSPGPQQGCTVTISLPLARARG